MINFIKKTVPQKFSSSLFTIYTKSPNSRLPGFLKSIGECEFFGEADSLAPSIPPSTGFRAAECGQNIGLSGVS